MANSKLIRTSIMTQTKQQKAKYFQLALIGLALLLFVTGVCIGSSQTGLSDILKLVTGELSNTKRIIITEIRIPRSLMALACGFSLAVAGVAMQGLFRNPLASPSILGVNAGASLGAALVIIFGAVLFPNISSTLQFYLLPLGAFIGASSVTLAAVRVGTINGRTQIYLLLLAGIAIQAIAGACLALLTYLSTVEQMRDMVFWSMGDLGYASWREIWLIIALLCLSTYKICKNASALNLLLIGEAEAGHLGVDVAKLKKSIILWTSLSVAVTIAFTGSIGFIGLLAPHLVRIIVGPDHRKLIISAGLTGACLLCLADILSRSFTADVIPVGIITALAGAPLFLKLLISEKKASL